MMNPRVATGKATFAYDQDTWVHGLQSRLISAADRAFVYTFQVRYHECRTADNTGPSCNRCDSGAEGSSQDDRIH